MNWYKKSQVSGDVEAERLYQNYMAQQKEYEIRDAILRFFKGQPLRINNITPIRDEDLFTVEIDITTYISKGALEKHGVRRIRYYIDKIKRNLEETIKTIIQTTPVIKISVSPPNIENPATYRFPEKRQRKKLNQPQPIEETQSTGFGVP